MPNATWSITNATTKNNLVVINASVNSDAPSAFYYDQHTNFLPFSSRSVLGYGNTDTITIPEVQKDSSGHNLPFTFIVADAQTLAPVKAITISADLSDLRDLTVSDTTLTDIAKVFDFQKNISAFPASDLATEFAAIDFSDESAVNEFFTLHNDYKAVTLDALHLVRSYYNALPYGWANGKNTTIYLYSGDYNNVADTEKVRSIGTLKITNDWTQALPLTVPDSFTVELKLSNDAARKLVFSNGVFWDSANTSFAKVALAASFVVPSQLTLDDASNKICTSLAGTLNGKDAFGLEAVAPSGPDGDGSFLELFHVRSFKDGMTLAMYGLGIAVAIGLIVKLGQFVKWCRERGNPTVDQKERAAQTEALKEYITDNARSIVRQVNYRINIPRQQEAIQADQAAYSAQQLNSKTVQSLDNVKSMLDSQIEQLAAMGNNFSGDDMQIVADGLDLVQTRLDRGTGPEALLQFRAELRDTLDILTTNNSNMYIAKVKIHNSLSVEERAAYDRAFEAFDVTRRIQQKIKEEIEEIEAGEDEREVVEDGGEGPSVPVEG